MTAPATGGRDPAALWKVVTAVGLAQVCVTVDYFALNVALPEMGRDLDVSPTDLQWAISAYLLSFAALLVVGGRLGDTFGRRRVMLIGIAIFGGASILCGVAPSVEFLVAARVVQGVGGAMLFPVSMAALNAAAPEEQRARALGMVVGIASVGTAVGPFVGGAITDDLGWRWLFFFNIPFAVAAILMTLRVVAESRDPGAARRIDVPGVAALAGGLVLVTLFIDRGAEWGWGSTTSLLVLAGGAGLLAAFVGIEARAASPLVDLSMLRNRAFVGVTIAGCLNNFNWAGMVFVVTLYLQQVRDLSPLEAGVVFLGMSLGVAAGGPLSGHLVARLPLNAVMAAATFVGAVGAVLISVVSAWAAWFPSFVLAGLGVGLAYALTNTGSLAVVPPEKGGAASGIVLTALVMMAALAVATCATVIEEVGGAPGAVGYEDGVDAALLVCAGAGLIGALVLAGVMAASLRPRPRPVEAP